MAQKIPAATKPQRQKVTGLQKSHGRPLSVGGKPIIAKMPTVLVEAIEGWGNNQGTN